MKRLFSLSAKAAIIKKSSPYNSKVKKNRLLQLTMNVAKDSLFLE